MSRFLLDVSALLALIDPQHTEHGAAHAWARRNPDARWLTCPIVQNGAMRIAGQPAYSRQLGAWRKCARCSRRSALSPATSSAPDDISLLDEARQARLARPDLLTSKSLTDVYLLALARHHDARLATFDRGIAVAAVPGGAAALELIEA